MPPYIRMADTYEKRLQAWRLVYDNYRKNGLVESKKNKIYFSIIDLLPITYTFVAEDRGRIIATLTLISNSTAGLPLANIFHKDLVDSQIDGQKIIEFSRLAVRDSHSSNSAFLSIRLMAAAVNWCITFGFDTAFLNVHPHHAPCWRRVLRAESISGIKKCSYVMGQPGVLLRIPLLEILNNPDILPPRGRKIFRDTDYVTKERQKTYRFNEREALELLSLDQSLLQTSSPALLRSLVWYFPTIKPLLRNNFNYGSERFYEEDGIEELMAG